MKKLLLIIMTSLTTINVVGQIGYLDQTFFASNNGTGKGFNGNISQAVRQPDGKLLCVGVFSKYGPHDAAKIARINVDGTLDTTFTTPVIPTGNVETVFLQSDGKILIGGGFTTVNSTTRAYVARLNSDGSLDTTFNAALPGSGAIVKTVVALSDDRIVIGGLFAIPAGYGTRRLTMLSSTGTVDSSFDQNINNLSTTLNGEVNGVVQAPNEKLYVKGGFPGGIMRLNIDGTKDTTFDIGTGPNCACINSITLTNNGNRVVLGGSFTSFAGDTNKRRLVKLLANGSIDPTFNLSSLAFNDVVDKVYSNSDNSLYVGGAFTSYDGSNYGRVIKLTPSGSVDTTFEDPKVGSVNVSGIIPFDNKLFIYGPFSSVNGINTSRLTLLNNDGSRDNSFMLPGNGFDATINKVAKQADGKIVVVGNFNFLDNSQSMYIARMNADGTRDTTFNAGTGFDAAPEKVYVDRNGKIVVVGSFTKYNGTTVSKIVRLNSNGSLDTTFSMVGSGVNSAIYGVDFDSNNKIYLVGLFSAYNGVARHKVLRLNNDGSLDTTFTSPLLAASVTVNVVKVLSDGNVLIAGNFSVSNGNKMLIAKLDSVGNMLPETTFYRAITPGIAAVDDLDIQADGKIVVIGTFTTIGSYTRPGIARYNINGTVDSTFGSMGVGFTTTALPKSIKVLSDGTMYVAGNFNTYNNNNRYGLAKLSSVGALLSVDNMTLNQNGIVYDMLYDEGWLYLAGPFTSYNAVPKNHLIKIFGYTPEAVAADQTLCPGSKVSNLVATGENLKWYSTATSNMPLAATTSLSTNTDYYVTQTILNVESTIKKKVRVTLQATAAPTGNAIQYLSSGSTLANLSVVGSNIKWYPTEDDALLKTNVLPASTVVTFNNKYYATQTIGTCESSLALEVQVKDITLGVSDINKVKASVYPNPARDVITITSANKVDKVVVYAMDGKKVSEGVLTNNQLNVSKLVRGQYLLQLVSSHGVETLKLIKE